MLQFGDSTPALGTSPTPAPDQIVSPAMPAGLMTNNAADSKTTPKNTAVTLAGSTNDTAGSLPIDNTSVVFPATQPAGAVVSNAGKTLIFTGQGTYQVQANGTVIFTPVTGQPQSPNSLCI